jgi:hypothetical protein
VTVAVRRPDDDGGMRWSLDAARVEPDIPRLDAVGPHVRVAPRIARKCGANDVIGLTQSGLPTEELHEEHGRGAPNALARLERAIQARR